MRVMGIYVCHTNLTILLSLEIHVLRRARHDDTWPKDVQLFFNKLYRIVYRYRLLEEKKLNKEQRR